MMLTSEKEDDSLHKDLNRNTYCIWIAECIDRQRHDARIQFLVFHLNCGMENLFQCGNNAICGTMTTYTSEPGKQYEPGLGSLHSIED